MNDSFEPFDESLLSAYLDNEVTESERILVESKLASDASVRQLLSELKTIRTWVAQSNRETTNDAKLNGPWGRLAFDEPETLVQNTIVPPQQSNTAWMLANFRWIASVAALLLVVVTTVTLWNSMRLDDQISNPTSMGPIVMSLDTKNAWAPSDARLFETPMAAESLQDSVKSDPQATSIQNRFSYAQNGSAVTLPGMALDSQDKSFEQLGKDIALGDVIGNTLEIGPEFYRQSPSEMFAFQNDIRQGIEDFFPIPPSEEKPSSTEVALREIDASPIVIELRIPKQSWTDGAKRLIQLGVPVSIDLPNVDILEYNIVPAPMQTSKQVDSIQRDYGNQSLQMELNSGMASKFSLSSNNAEPVPDVATAVAGSEVAQATGSQRRGQVLAWQYQSKATTWGEIVAPNNDSYEADKRKEEVKKHAQTETSSFVRVRLYVLKSIARETREEFRE